MLFTIGNLRWYCNELVTICGGDRLIHELALHLGGQGGLNMKKMILLGLGLFVAVNAVANDVVGKWNGKAEFDVSEPRAHLEKNGFLNPKIEAWWKQQAQELNSVTCQLHLKADGTFTLGSSVKVSQWPLPKSGKWKQKGDTLTLMGAKDQEYGYFDGKVSVNGKSLTIDGMQVRNRMRSSRQPIEKLTWTFKRA